MQTEQLSRLQLSPVWGKTMNVKFTFQSSPSLFWVLTKCPGRESSGRKNPHPIFQLSICWLLPRHLKHLGHLKPLTSPGAQCHPERLPKPPGDQIFSGAARGVLQFPRHGQVEQCLGTLDHSRSPAAAVAHYPRAPQLSLNIHMRLTGSSPGVSKFPEAAWAG